MASQLCRLSHLTGLFPFSRPLRHSVSNLTIYHFSYWIFDDHAVLVLLRHKIYKGQNSIVKSSCMNIKIHLIHFTSAHTVGKRRFLILFNKHSIRMCDLSHAFAKLRIIFTIAFASKGREGVCGIITA